MKVKVGVNGFGRMGRLTMRAAWEMEGVQFVQVNDPAGDANTLAHLLNYDSVHGKWAHVAESEGDNLVVSGQRIACTANERIEDTDWSGCDVVIEASGRYKKKAELNGYLKQGVKRVVVTAPVKEVGVVDIVMGVNHQLYQPSIHPIVSAASCTTNCLLRW
jgi:glyceraldehyde 3-phosphate dehydrogenase